MPKKYLHPGVKYPPVQKPCEVQKNPTVLTDEQLQAAYKYIAGTGTINTINNTELQNLLTTSNNSSTTKNIDKNINTTKSTIITDIKKIQSDVRTSKFTAADMPQENVVRSPTPVYQYAGIGPNGKRFNRL